MSRSPAIDAALDHFIVLDSLKGNNMHVRCKFCNKEFHSSGHRLVFHLACIERRSIRLCGNVPESVRKKLRQLMSAESSASAPENSVHIDSESDTDSVIDLVSTRPTKQMKLDDMLSDVKRKTADKRWSEFVYAENIPLSKLDSPFFKRAIEATIGLPAYRPPGRKLLSGRLLDDAHAAMETSVKEALTSVASTGELLVGNVVARFNAHYSRIPQASPSPRMVRTRTIEFIC
jgi:hypothetical protein